MTTTAHLDLTLIETAQAQKEVTANQAFARIDALLNTGAIDKDLATPPGSPAEGDVYIVASSATGDWVGQDASIAYFEQIWRFVTPREGVTLWVNDENQHYNFNGSSWAVLGAGKKTKQILAPLWTPTASAGSAPVTAFATSTGKPDIVALSFDASVDQYASFVWRMPKSWNEGSIIASFEWTHPTTTTDFDVVWGIQAVAAGAGDAIDTSYGAGAQVTDTGGTEHVLYRSSVTSAISIAASPTTYDDIFLRIYRKASDAADTMAVDARLINVVLIYYTDALTDD